MVNGYAKDRQGNIYVIGQTNSYLLPTTESSYQRKLSSVGPCSESGCEPGDGFIAKLDPTGSHVLAATYLGDPNSIDSVYSIDIDPQGNPVVAVGTGLPLKPDEGTLFHNGPTYIVKFDPLLSRILSVIPWPGVGSFRFDDDGEMLILSFSADKVDPRVPGFRKTCKDSWTCLSIERVTGDGKEIKAAAQFPAWARKFRLGRNGTLWLAGESTPDALPVGTGSRLRRRWKDGYFHQYFISHFDHDLQLLSISEVLPEFEDYDDAGAPYIFDMEMTEDGLLYAIGRAQEGVPVTPSAAQPAPAGSNDGFFAVVRPSGELQYASYLGTPKDDTAQQVLIDDHGVGWVFGFTLQNALPESPVYSGWVVAIDPSKFGDASLVRSFTTPSRVLDEDSPSYSDVIQLLNNDFLIIAPTGSPTPDNLDTVPGIRSFTMANAPAAQVALSIDSPTTIRSHATYTFDVTLTNTGQSPASNNKLLVRLPDTTQGGVQGQFVTLQNVDTSQGSCTAAFTVECDLGAIAPGDSVMVRLYLKQKNIGDFWSFETQASWQDPQGTRHYNWESRTNPYTYGTFVDLKAEISPVTSIVKKGTQAHYLVKLSNKGPDSAQHLHFYFYLRDAAVTIQPNAGAYTCGAARDYDIYCDVKPLAAGDEIQMPIDVTYDKVTAGSIAGAMGSDWWVYQQNRDDNHFSFPTQVVDEIRSPVLKDWRFVAHNHDNQPELRFSVDDWYVTTGLLWDGKARQSTYLPFLVPPALVVPLTHHELHSGGEHTVQACTPDVGCSNVIRIRFNSEGKPENVEDEQGDAAQDPRSKRIQPTNSPRSQRVVK